VQIAAARILQAQAQLGITRADQLPSIAAGASATDQRSPRSKAGFGTISNIPAFNLKREPGESVTCLGARFLGKVSTLDRGCAGNLLASEWARQEVIGTLVANVASAYFQLRELDLELEISKGTLVSRKDSLKLTQLLADHGATSLLDVRQAEQLVFTAAEQVPDLERRIEQQENFISTLLGKNPGAESHVGGALPSSHTRPKSRPALPLLCWNAGPISARLSNN